MEIPESLSVEEFQETLERLLLEWSEARREEGRQDGRREGKADLLIRQLGLRFGPLDEQIRARVLSGDSERLLQWSERILTARTLQDVFGD